MIVFVQLCEFVGKFYDFSKEKDARLLDFERFRERLNVLKKRLTLNDTGEDGKNLILSFPVLNYCS